MNISNRDAVTFSKCSLPLASSPKINKEKIVAAKVDLNAVSSLLGSESSLG